MTLKFKKEKVKKMPLGLPDQETFKWVATMSTWSNFLLLTPGRCKRCNDGMETMQQNMKSILYLLLESPAT